MSDTINQKNNQVFNGNIVGGNLTINQAISPEMILDPIQNILTYIRHRDPIAAQKILDTLFSASHLDNQTKGVLSILAILLSIAKNTPPENSYSIIMSYLSGDAESIWTDIAISALMRLDIYNGRPEDAKKRYESKSASYCQEVFFEYIADHKTLKECFINNVFQLSEPALCGVARGLLRCESYDLALSVSEKLTSMYPNFNSKVVQHIIKCAHLNKNLYPTHFWLISNSDRKEILVLADETTLLIEECKGMDYRVVGQAYAFLNYLYGGHKNLFNACWSNITNIEVFNNYFSLYLRSTMEKDFEDEEGIFYDIKRSENDFSYRKSLILRLSESEELSTEEVILFGRIAEGEAIRDWMNRGGTVTAESDLERDFIAIELKCYAYDGSRKSKDEIKNLVENFSTNQKGSFQYLNLPKLFELTSRLLEIGLAHQVAALLQQIVPQVDLWPSPLIKNYIHALLESDQLASLKNIISEISQTDWDAYIWQIKARQLDLIDDKSGALAAIESALNLSPLSLQCWHHWLFLHKRSNIQKNHYSDILVKIPNEIFTNTFKSHLAWQILYEISITGEFSRAEKIVVDWFIQDPDLCAKKITDFHFSRSFSGNKESIDTVAATTDLCLGGYHYLVNGRSLLKLIVLGANKSHSCILESTSKLGNILLGLKTGESIKNGMQDIKLLEILPPYVAVLRLALELRQANNDGSDCFHSFSLPEDPEEMVRELEKKIQAADNESKQQFICENPQIPLFLKGHAMGNGCPVHSALHHLTNKRSVKSPLPTVGEMQLKDIIIDIYAATYLGLTGLIHGFIESKVEFIITVETRAHLINFVAQVTRDDYMRIGLTAEGRLWRVTSKEVQPQIEGVLLAINYILECAKNISPNLVDMSPNIIQIEDALDDSTYSSLRLSISNDLPWLCIDEAFAQLSFKSGYRVINSIEFFSSIGKNIEIRNKLPGLYHHVCSGLPYPLTHEEIIQMANLDDEHSHYYLSEILIMYPNAYADINSAVEHLSRVIILTLIRAYVNGEILNGFRVNNPKNNGHAERVFNVCCFLSLQVRSDLNAERKLAFLLYTVASRLHEADDMKQLVKILGSNFIAGHFLNFEEVNKGVRDYSLKNGLSM